MNDKIRSQLQNGMSIDEVCRKYHLTFKELVRLMSHGLPIRQSHRPKSWLYITEVQGKYVLIKNKVYYGKYNTFADARCVRDYFVKHGWDKDEVDYACQVCGVERCK